MKRFLLLCTFVVLAGVTTGVFAGRVMSGDAEGSPDTRQAELPAIRDVLARMPLPFSQPQSNEETAFRGGDVNNLALALSPQTDSGPPPDGLRSPLAIEGQGADPPPRFSQVSRQVPASLNISVRPPFLGDINGDNVVDTTDVLLLAAALGTSPPEPEAADLNGDGRVDILDLAPPARRGAPSTGRSGTT